ncbi:DnaD domain protein [Apilactobacillus sp. TMW 2.2459]|uniref:DnaD domain protein n=1 Tax=Apilactobacillus xinyiensis TaxID=2841032 RepID=UPI00200FCA47|nr:DnaD domain protein [Apilactobacillus xinyiensis]MCL0312822.1 DnaD domain protein [Apilactobacillus xinyiensis]
MTQNTRYFLQVPVANVSGKNLTSTEKLVYGHIFTILNANDKCFISNKRIGENIEVSERSVSRAVSKLKSIGLIDVNLVYKENSKEVEKRYITLSDRYLGGDTDDRGVVTQVSIPPRHRCLYPHDTDGVDNKKINKKINRSSSSESDSDKSAQSESSKPKINPKKNPYELYQQLWGFPNPIVRQDLQEWINEFSSDVVYYAIYTAGQRNVSSWGIGKYLKTVFDSWEKEKVKNLEQAKQQNAEHEHRNERNYKSRKPYNSGKRIKEELPEWAKDKPKPEPKDNKPVEDKPVDLDKKRRIQEMMKELDRK